MATGDLLSLCPQGLLSKARGAELLFHFLPATKPAAKPFEKEGLGEGASPPWKISGSLGEDPQLSFL